MKLRHLGFLLVGGFIQNVLWAQPSTSTVVQESTVTIESPPAEPTTSSEESEAKGIIPFDSEIQISTQILTPTSYFHEKNPYDQAMAELARAQELWKKGHAEAASDAALEAYDDLIELRRVPGVKRATIREKQRQAAGIYIEAGISYIKRYVVRMGSSKEAKEEGRARMEDLRDVARNYKDLNKQLNSAIQELLPPPVVKPKKPS